MRTEVEFNGVTYVVFNYDEFKDHTMWYTDVDGVEKQYYDEMLHLWGEMDLPLHLSYEQARGIAYNAMNCCGYYVVVNDANRTIDCHGDYGTSQRVTYGEQGGIVNVEDITLQMKIEVVEREIKSLEQELTASRKFGQTHSFGTPLANIEAWIEVKQGTLDDLKEQLNVQNGNS